jgi:hypothetical protein
MMVEFRPVLSRQPVERGLPAHQPAGQSAPSRRLEVQGELGLCLPHEPPLCADGSWIPVKTLAIQIRVFCAASRPGDAGRAGRGGP